MTWRDRFRDKFVEPKDETPPGSRPMFKDGVRSPEIESFIEEVVREAGAKAYAKGYEAGKNHPKPETECSHGAKIGACFICGENV